MRRFFKWLKIEFWHIFPVFVFFFVAFNVLNFTETFLLRRAGLSTYSLVDVTVAAALIAKIFLVIDHLPVSCLFFEKPLIYLVIWKTILYWIITFLVRMAIRLFPYLFLKEGIVEEWQAFISHVEWRLVASIQGWYLMLLFLYVTSRELGRVIGPAKVRRIFFGKKR